MSDNFKVYIDEKDLKECAAYLDKFGREMSPVIRKAIDWATGEIANHAKSSHFFVGVGKGSSKAAEENKYAFVNPDGTPRFKARTGDLRNSIQSLPSRMSEDSVYGEVRAGAGMDYAQKVEEGSPKSGAFPYMRPALEATKQPFIKYLVTNIKAFVKSKGGEA